MGVLVAEDARTLADRVAEGLCQMITSRDQRVTVLMLTAAAAPQDRVAGLGLGADDYLTKPFHFPELVLRGLPHRQPRRVNLLPDDSGRC